MQQYQKFLENVLKNTVGQIISLSTPIKRDLVMKKKTKNYFASFTIMFTFVCILRLNNLTIGCPS